MSERNIQGNADSWVELTENDVTSLRVQNLGSYDLFVKRGTIAAPMTIDGSIRLKPYDIFFETISDLWPGGSGSRVWGYSETQIHASVSHE